MSPKTIEFITKVGFPIFSAIAIGGYVFHKDSQIVIERNHWRVESREERKGWVEVMKVENELNRKATEKLTDAVRSLEMTISKER